MPRSAGGASTRAWQRPCTRPTTRGREGEGRRRVARRSRARRSVSRNCGRSGRRPLPLAVTYSGAGGAGLVDALFRRYDGGPAAADRSRPRCRGRCRAWRSRRWTNAPRCARRAAPATVGCPPQPFEGAAARLHGPLGRRRPRIACRSRPTARWIGACRSGGRARDGRGAASRPGTETEQRMAAVWQEVLGSSGSA